MSLMSDSLLEKIGNTSRVSDMFPDPVEQKPEDNILEAAYHGLLSATGNMIHTANDAIAMAGKPRMYTDQEWMEKQSDLSKWISQAGRDLEQAHERNYEPWSANRIVSGVAGVVPYALGLGAAGAAAARTGNYQAIGNTAWQAATRMGLSPRTAEIASQVAPAAVFGPAIKAPESLIEGQGAYDEYIEEAKRNGTYIPNVTEVQARKLADDVARDNMALLMGTGSAEELLLSQVPGGYTAKNIAQKLLGGMGVNAAEEMAQQIFPKAEGGKDWNLTDEDVLEAGLIGAISGGAMQSAGIGMNWLADRNNGTDEQESQQNDTVFDTGHGDIDRIVSDAARRYDLSPELIHKVIQQESSYNPEAVSDAGAQGLMQLMPGTAQGLGVSDSFDPEQNINGGAKYLRQMLDEFDGDVRKALAAYNAGPNNIEAGYGYADAVLGRSVDGTEQAAEGNRGWNPVEAASDFFGKRMDNGENGCVEAVTKIGAAGGNPFLADQLEKGVVYVPTLVENAGDMVIPFDASKLQAGDVIVYGDDDHVVIYDGNGGYVGNSSSQMKVIHGDDYTAMGEDLPPTKIIKTGGQGGSAPIQQSASQMGASSSRQQKPVDTYDDEVNSIYEGFIREQLKASQSQEDKDFFGGFFDKDGNFEATKENIAKIEDRVADDLAEDFDKYVEAQETSETGKKQKPSQPEQKPLDIKTESLGRLRELLTDAKSEAANNGKWDTVSNISRTLATGNEQAIRNLAGQVLPVSQPENAIQNQPQTAQQVQPQQVTTPQEQAPVSTPQTQQQAIQDAQQEQSAQQSEPQTVQPQQGEEQQNIPVQGTPVRQAQDNSAQNQVQPQSTAVQQQPISQQPQSVQPQPTMEQRDAKIIQDAYNTGMGAVSGKRAERIKQGKGLVITANAAGVSLPAGMVDSLRKGNKNIILQAQDIIRNVGVTAPGYGGTMPLSRQALSSVIGGEENESTESTKTEGKETGGTQNQDKDTESEQVEKEEVEGQKTTSQNGVGEVKEEGQRETPSEQAKTSQNKPQEAREAKALSQFKKNAAKVVSDYRNDKISYNEAFNKIVKMADRASSVAPDVKTAEAIKEEAFAKVGELNRIHEEKNEKAEQGKSAQESTTQEEESTQKEMPAQSEFVERYINERHKDNADEIRKKLYEETTLWDDETQSHKRTTMAQFLEDFAKTPGARVYYKPPQKIDGVNVAGDMGEYVYQNDKMKADNYEPTLNLIYYDYAKYLLSQNKGQSAQSEAEPVSNEGGEKSTQNTNESKLQRMRRGREEMQAVAKKYADGEITQTKAYSEIAEIAKDIATVPKDGTPNVTFIDGNIRRELSDYGNSLIDEAKAPEEKAETKQEEPAEAENNTVKTPEQMNESELEEWLFHASDKEVEQWAKTTPYKKVSQSGSSYITATLYNTETGQEFVICVRDYDYNGERDIDALYTMPIDKEAYRAWQHKHGKIVEGDIVEVVKGRKVPVGTISRVKKIRSVRDKYDRWVADYADLENGQSTNVTNCQRVEEGHEVESAENNTVKEYKYYMNRRGVSPGAQPKGFTRFDEEDKGGRHGAIYYDHPLTEQEIADYELTPAEEENTNEQQGESGSLDGGHGGVRAGEGRSDQHEGTGEVSGRDGREGKTSSGNDVEGHSEESQPVGVRAGAELDTAAGKGTDKRGNQSDVPLTEAQAHPSSTETPGHNYEIKDTDQSTKSEKVRFKQNVEAIKMLKQLEEEDRMPTPAEQEILAGYNGWGGLKGAFIEGSDMNKEIRELLTEEEYKEARKTINDAFYTPPKLIRAIWEGISHLGFKGGRVLDPSMGVGNFFGTMPRDMMDKSTLRGVESDDLTSRLGKMLYPNAFVEHKGFQKSGVADNYFDLAISNIPFGQKMIDGYQVHNFFFANGIDKVRPGGLMVYITSQGSLAGGKDAVKMRNYLSGQADLIAAYKLPSGVFSDAGTQVATDIVIFRKRDKDGKKSPYGQKFADVKEVKRGEGYYAQKLYDINEYFEDHPENILGEQSNGKDQWGNPALNVKMAEGTTLADVANDLESAMKKLPDDVYQPVSRKKAKAFDTASAQKRAAAAEKTRDYEYYYKDGKPVQNQNGQEVAVTGQKAKIVDSYLKLKNTLNALFAAESDPKATSKQVESVRKKLNKDYDAFVAKHGLLTGKAAAAFRDDPSAGMVQALEKPQEETYKDKKGNERKRIVGAEKADIFSVRSIKPVQEVTHVESADDALLASLTNRGGVDLDYMAGLMNSKPEKLVSQLKGKVFKNPVTEDYETREEYLSGNVREKLAQAKEAAKSDKAYADNVKELEKVVPEDLVADEIYVNLGTPWIPVSDVQDFVNSIADGLTVKFSRGAALWNVTGWGSSAKYKLKGITLAELFDHVLNNKAIQIFDGSGDNKVFNKEKTDAANVAAEELQQDFRDWIWKDKEREKRLTRYYNDNYNNTVVRQYNGQHLNLHDYGMNAKITLKPHQKDVVWRMLQGQNTLIAHCVGAGKTFEMQAAGMEMRRLGIANKPMYCLPNNVVQQFAREFRILYPNAKLLVLQSNDLPAVEKTSKLVKTEDGRTKRESLLEGKTPEQKTAIMAKRTARNRMLNRIRTEDWDGIIISHNLFQRFPVTPETAAAFIQQEIDNLEQTIREARADKSMDTRALSNLENAKKNLEERLEDAISTDIEDIGVPFEELGVDQLFVDEADMFKNLEFATRLGNIRGLSNSKANRSRDMFIKTQWLTNTLNGRGVVFATGTPVSNTMSELYTMMRYLDMKGLKEKGLELFDNWLRTFGDIGQGIERKPTGDGFRKVTMIKRFINMAELTKMFRKFADVKVQEELNLNIPKLKNGKSTVVALEPDPRVVDYIKNVVPERVKNMKSGFKKEKGEDNMLSLTNDLRKLSLTDSKIEACADAIVRKYHETTETKGTQLVFCDMGIPKAEKGETALTDKDGEAIAAIESPEVYRKLIEKLKKKGIPEKDIAFIQNYNTKQKRDDVFQKVNKGEVRILIGSTETMGAGTNCQTHLVALHDLDAPWRPRDLEQRHGRILRQGNENKEVEIYNYVVKDSFDANMWEKLKNKAAIIQQAMSGDMNMRTVEDSDLVTLSYAEVEGAATGNPLIKEQLQVQNDLTKYQHAQTAFRKKVRDAENTLDGADERVDKKKREIAKVEKDIAQRKDTKGDKFSMLIGKSVYKERGKADEALAKLLGNLSKRNPVEIGQIGGFRLMGYYDGVEPKLSLVNNLSYDVNKNSVQGIEYVLNHAPETELANLNAGLERMEKDIAQADEIVKQENPYAEKVKALSERLNQLNREIAETLVEDGKQQEQEAGQKDVEPEFQNFAIEKTAGGSYKVTLKDAKSVSNVDRLTQSARLENSYTGTDGNSFTFTKRIYASNFARNNDGRVERKEPPKPTQTQETQETQEKPSEQSGTVNFEAGSFRHTKTGEMIPQAKLKDGSDSERNKRIAALAKNYGGKWSRYSKSLLFKSEAKRDEFLEAAEALLASTDPETMAKLSITAWHGSPHKFDSFSLQSIGTGEGAQVHGWGLYFAQDRGVSEGYRESLSQNRPSILINGYKATRKHYGWSILIDENTGESETFENDSIDAAALDAYAKAEGNIEKAHKYLELKYGESKKRQITEAMEILNGEELEYNKPGSLLRVEIPDEDVMLDEDKPLNKQPLFVKKFILKYYKSRPDVYDVPDSINSIGYDSGGTFYRSVVRQMKREGKANPEKAASETLNSFGIKGITYEGGRDGRCYVVFDDQAIDIIERFSAEALSESEIRRMMMEANPVDNEKLTSQQRKLSALGEELGSPVIWVDADSRLHGWHQSGFTFLNVNSKADLEKTFWHETFHWIRSNNKQDYKKIVRYIQRYSRITKEQMDKWRKKTGRFDLSDEDVIEEMLCDSFYDAAGRVKELRTLANNNPSLAQRVMAWIKRLADRFKEFMHGREGGLTTSQMDNLTRVVGKLAATMKDGKGRPIFGVYRNGTEIRLANGQFLPAVSFSASGKNVLDNSENIGDNKNNQTSIGDRITVHENGSISIRLKYQPKSHETQKARLERRKAEVRDIDTALVKNGDRSAYVNLVPKRNKEAIDSAIARGVNPVDIAHNYRLRYNKELANYSDSVPEGKKIEMLLLLKGAELYATGKSRLHNDTGGSGGVSRSSDGRDIGKVGAKGTSENSITKDDKHSSGSASSMPKFSYSSSDNSTPSLMQRIKNMLSGVSNNEQAKTMYRKDMAQMIENALGVKIRFGKMNPPADGSTVIYKENDKVIRSMHAYDWENILPVAGGLIAERLGISNKASDTTPEMRNYIADWILTGAANNTSPEAKQFQKAMAKHPAYADKLIGLRTKFQDWADKTEQEKMRQTVQWSKDKSRTWKERKDLLYEQFVEELAPVENLVKNFEKATGKKLEDTINPMTAFRLFHGSYGRAITMIEGVGDAAVDGLKMNFPGVDFTGFKTLRTILADIGALQNPEKQKDFGTYCIACHMMDMHKSNKDIILEQKKFERWIQEIKDGKRQGDEETIEEYEKTIRELQEEIYETPPQFSWENCEMYIREGKDKYDEAQKTLVRFSNVTAAILANSGVISYKHYTDLLKKWPNYVPLFRVFEENENIDFGDSMKKLAGSTRDIINPIESIIHNTVDFIKKAEKNKAKCLLADLARCEGSGWLTEEVDNSKPNTKTTVTFYENGVRKYLETDPAIVEAINNMDRSNSNTLIKFIHAVTAMARACFTIASPEFAVRNVFRDYADMAVYNKYGFVSPADWVRGLIHAMNRDSTYYEWLSSGAAMASAVSLDRNYTQEMVDKLNRSWGSRFASKQFGKALLEALQKASEYSEYATRISMYEKAKKAVQKEQKADIQAAIVTAALQSRDLMDFSRHGKAGEMWNKWVPFANASLQGMNKFYRTILDPQLWKEDRKQATWALARLMLSSALPAMVLFLAHHDDDWYKEAPDWLKETHWLFKIGDTVIRIPKGSDVGIRFISNLVEKGMAEAYDKEKVKATEYFKPLMDAVPDLFPIILKPMTEAMLNKSFFTKRNIVPQYQEKLPEKLQYGPYTTELSKFLGEKLGIAPSKIDHVIAGYAGSLGMAFPKALDLALGTQQLDLAPTEMPLTRSITYMPYKNPRSVTKYYELLDEQTKYENEYKLTKNRPEEFDPGLLERLKAKKKFMTKLSKEERDVINNPNLTVEQRKKKQMDIQQKRINLVKQVVK